MSEATAGPRNHDIIVVGASAGGVPALRKLVSGFPEDLPAAVFVAMHVPAEHISLLAQILSRAGPIRAEAAEDEAPILPNHIYVATPGRHLILEGDVMRLRAGPRVNRHRPAIDALFRTAAASHGCRVVGVVLTGLSDDGTVGLAAIKAAGGVTVVQDPDEAAFPSMPASALSRVAIDYCVPLVEMPALLVWLVGPPPLDYSAVSTKDRSPALTVPVSAAGSDGNGHGPSAPSASTGSGVRVPSSSSGEQAEDMSQSEDTGRLSTADVNPIGQNASAIEGEPGSVDGRGGDGKEGPSPFTCPECHGTLWKVGSGALSRYRCRVGHSYSPDSLLSAQDDALESALWAGLRALEERQHFAHVLVSEATARGHEMGAAEYLKRAEESRAGAATIRAALSQILEGAEPDPTLEAWPAQPSAATST